MGIPQRTMATHAMSNGSTSPNAFVRLNRSAAPEMITRARFRFSSSVKVFRMVFHIMLPSEVNGIAFRVRKQYNEYDTEQFV